MVTGRQESVPVLNQLNTPTGRGPLAGILAAIAMAGIPLIVAPGATLQYETAPKLVLLLVCAAGLLLCHRAWWPGTVALFEDRRGRLLLLLLAAQAISLALATALSSQPEFSLSGSSWRRYGLVTQLALVVLSAISAALAVGAGAWLRKAMLAIVSASGIAAIYSIAQDANLDPFLPRASYAIKYWQGELVRGPATLGHAVYLGSFLASTIPLALGLASEARGMARYALRAVAALSVVAAVLSGSRSSLLALAAAAAVSLPLLRGIRRRTWMVGGFACIAVALALLLPFRTTVGLHLDRWRADMYGGPRLQVWRESLGLAAAHPLAGSGPDTFASEFRRRQSAELSRAYPDFTQESPHNFLLDGVISQGFSFVLVIAGLAWLVFRPLRVPAKGPALWIRAAFASTLVSLLFVSTTICGALMLFVLPALYAGAAVPTNRRSRTAPPVFAKVAACVMAGLFLLAAYAFLRKDVAYASLAQDGRNGRFEAMAEDFRTSVSSSFPAPGEDLWCSRQFAAMARVAQPPNAAWALAAEAAGRAERVGDARADAAYQSALLAIGMNRAEPAASALRRAIGWAPTWYKPHLLLAQLLRFTGPASEADAEAGIALDLSGAMRPTVEEALRPTQAR